MNNLISRDAVLAMMDKYIDMAGDDNQMHHAMCVVAEGLKEQEAIDAVPVVRCRDCKHRCTYKCPMYHTETCLDDLDGFDDYNVDRTDNDGFCHLGARMDSESEEER